MVLRPKGGLVVLANQVLGIEMSTPETATLGSTLLQLLPVVVGGLLTLTGGAGMQWLLHTKKTEEERRTKRAAKFEELVTALYEHDHWLDTLKNIRVFGETLPDGPSPLSKVQAIVALYFPQFGDHLSKLESATLAFKVWIADRSHARVSGNTSDLIKGYKEVYGSYNACLRKFLDDLQELARTGLEVRG
jgi:hypothetical protein